MALLIDGAAISLAGTTVKFLMKLPSAGSPVVSAPAIIDDAVNGYVSYQWAVGDTATPGVYRAEWEITYANGQTQTVPADGYDIVEVVADLG